MATKIIGWNGQKQGGRKWFWKLTKRSIIDGKKGGEGGEDRRHFRGDKDLHLCVRERWDSRVGKEKKRVTRYLVHVLCMQLAVQTVMSYFRGDDEALLAVALTGFT